MYGRFTSAVEQLCHGKVCRGGVPFVGHRQVSNSFRTVRPMLTGPAYRPAPRTPRVLTFVPSSWSPTKLDAWSCTAG